MEFQSIKIQRHPQIVSVNLSISRKRIVSSNIPDVRKLLPVVLRLIQMSCWILQKKISYAHCLKGDKTRGFQKNSLIKLDDSSSS